MKFLKLNKNLLAAFALTTVLFACKKEKPTEIVPDKPELSSAGKLENIHMCTAELFSHGGGNPKSRSFKVNQMATRNRDNSEFEYDWLY